MNIKSKWIYVLIFSLFFLFSIYGYLEANEPSTSDQQTILSDSQLPAFQNELLDLAFDFATAIPVNPHIKDRSRAQESVVYAALKLDQPLKAVAYNEKIENWRKGSAYVDIALYSFERGVKTEAENFLKSAETITDPDQEWRTATIQTKISRLKNMMDKSGLGSDKDLAPVDLRKDLNPKKIFNKKIKELDGVIATGDFDATNSALLLYTDLFRDNYQEKKKRALIDKKIKRSWKKTPYVIRIDILLRLAEHAAANNDPKTSTSYIEQAQDIVDKNEWPLDYSLAINSKIAAARYKAGDGATASKILGEVHNRFVSEGNKIVNIDRRETLVPLAEAYELMNDQKNALTIYKLAVEESMENPNSRPRAEDLSAICASMALNAVEPDAELWQLIRDIKNNLGDPW